MEIGNVVRSYAGHDKDSFFMVTGIEAGYVYIADGKSRKLENPKRKNIKHVRATSAALDVKAVRTDKTLRELLKPFNERLKHGSKSGTPERGGN